nr:hypothetical protein [Tanacetum cinerariifolium]
MNTSLLGASVLALALAVPLAAHAHQAGDIIVRAGAATTAPNEDSGNLKFDGVKAPGTKATLDSDTQLGLTFAYMLTDHVGLELLAATPFQHTVAIKGLGAGLDGKLADVKQLPPTLSLQYYPMEANSNDRKGQGMNNLHLKNSWGWAGQVGMDYMLTDRIMVNAAVWYIDIDTQATLDGPSALSMGRTKVNVDVDPWVYMLGFGYKF